MWPYLQVAHFLGELFNQMVGPDMVGNLAAQLSNLPTQNDPLAVSGGVLTEDPFFHNWHRAREQGTNHSEIPHQSPAGR